MCGSIRGDATDSVLVHGGAVDKVEAIYDGEGMLGVADTNGVSLVYTGPPVEA